MNPLPRYLLYQTAGWAGVALTVLLLHLWADVPLWVTGAILGAWILKDLLLYPWLRRSFETPGHSRERELVGARAVAEQGLGPEGWVRVRGELWRARGTRSVPLRAGQAVRVTEVDGMTLVVEPDDGESTQAP